jgi:2-(1,2-epoxy-1,2-dihydrophenyl)acetyl-CoA isomerase
MILSEKKDGVLKLVLNRPEALNAFTVPMLEALRAAFKDAAKDKAVRSVLVIGAGRAFSVGQDLKEHLERKPSFLAHLREHYNPLIAGVRSLEKPVVAAVNGAAAGAGLGMVLACDIRLASAKAAFHTAFIKLSLIADSGTALFLSRLIGHGRAVELLMTGRPVDSAEAERIGLVSKIVAPESLEADALALARELAQGPPRGLALMKRLADRTLFARSLEEQLELEAQLQEVAGRSRDHAEGVAAFVEKRPARFGGE